MLACTRISKLFSSYFADIKLTSLWPAEPTFATLLCTSAS
uniref:Uncharacterized protein n=1 Tax=Anguilla anguilla TaxID=7936 RepID=A0A0E9TBZ7_ANGAN